jgi:UDP-glucose 4-epimerase
LEYKTSVDLDTGLARMIEAIRKRGVRDFKYHLDLEIVNEKTPRTWKDRLF